jgi:hypothetical protein
MPDGDSFIHGDLNNAQSQTFLNRTGSVEDTNGLYALSAAMSRTALDAPSSGSRGLILTTVTSQTVGCGISILPPTLAATACGVGQCGAGLTHV